MSSQPAELDPTNPVEHHTAIETHLQANVNPDIAIFDVGEEPSPLPDYFAVPHVSRRFGDSSVRGGGHRGTHDWRVVVKCTARTAGGCRWVMWQITRALEERAVAIGGPDGEDTSLFDLESTQLPEADDDGYQTAAETFTFTH